MSTTTGNALYSVVSESETKICVTSECGVPISIRFDFYSDSDHCSSGNGRMCKKVKQKFVKCDKPISIPYTTITKDNVLDEICKLVEAIESADCGEDTENLFDAPDGYLHVSSKVYAAAQLAQTRLQGQFVGVGSAPAPVVFGLRLIKQPKLKGSTMIYAETSNLHFGTNLMSDMNSSNAMIWVDKKCETVCIRLGTWQGIQIDKFCRIATNLCGLPDNFCADQPEGQPFGAACNTSGGIVLP